MVFRATAYGPTACCLAALCATASTAQLSELPRRHRTSAPRALGTARRTARRTAPGMSLPLPEPPLSLDFEVREMSLPLLEILLDDPSLELSMPTVEPPPEMSLPLPKPSLSLDLEVREMSLPMLELDLDALRLELSMSMVEPPGRGDAVDTAVVALGAGGDAGGTLLLASFLVGLSALAAGGAACVVRRRHQRRYSPVDERAQERVEMEWREGLPMSDIERPEPRSEIERPEPRAPCGAPSGLLGEIEVELRV